MRCSPVRDITSDLKERIARLDSFLAEAEKQVQEAHKQLDDLKGERGALVRTLEIEMRRNGVTGPSPVAVPSFQRFLKPNPDAPAKPDLVTFIMDLICLERLTKEELRDRAYTAGYFGGEEAGGRVLHATLMNLIKHQRILAKPDGTLEPYPAERRQGVLING
jgi:hypothetical protein